MNAWAKCLRFHGQCQRFLLHPQLQGSTGRETCTILPLSMLHLCRIYAPRKIPALVLPQLSIQSATGQPNNLRNHMIWDQQYSARHVILDDVHMWKCCLYSTVMVLPNVVEGVSFVAFCPSTTNCLFFTQFPLSGLLCNGSLNQWFPYCYASIYIII